MRLFDFLEKNTEKLGMYTIEYNPYTSCYKTIVEHFEDIYECGGWGGWGEDVNTFEEFIDSEVGTERYKKILEQGKFYELQWYPRTPISFCNYYAADMDDLEKQVFDDNKDKI